jgi:hypothetical protein
VIEEMIKTCEALIVKHKAMGDDAAVRATEVMIAELRECLCEET